MCILEPQFPHFINGYEPSVHSTQSMDEWVHDVRKWMSRCITKPQHSFCRHVGIAAVWGRAAPEAK